MRRLADRWPLAGLSDVRDALLAAYAEEDRGYHDSRHLAEVLDRLDELMPAGHPSRDAVVLAAWFHDAVYDGEAGAERRSADWARRVLPEPRAGEVARLVELTESHRPADDDVDGQLLCDADLAILAAGTERYAEYVAGVRQEYAEVSDSAFRAGRAAVLRDLLAKPTLFHTDQARERWEGAARANVAAELRRLER